MEYQEQHFVGETSKELVFAGSIFSGCRFEQGHFDKGSWKGARFIDCQFHYCYLSNLELDGASFQNVEFYFCKLVGLSFALVSQKFFYFEAVDSKLIGCNFSNLKWKRGSFLRCQLIDCYFQEAEIPEMNFQEADLGGTIFHHTDLTKADFRKSQNYLIDIRANQVRRAKFSFPEAASLLKCFDIEIE